MWDYIYMRGFTYIHKGIKYIHEGILSNIDNGYLPGDDAM